MFEKNNPVLISMPRCGSTVTGKMLYNISHHRYGSKNYLNQYTTVLPQYYSEFERRDGRIQQVTYRREKNGFVKEFENRAAVIHERVQLLQGDTRYTMKLFADDLTPEILEFLQAHYDFIFLERRDTLAQVLSYSTMMVTNRHEYRQVDQFPHSYFDIRHCLLFLNYMIQYKRIKKQNPDAKVIYYEDLMKFTYFNNNHNTEARIEVRPNGEYAFFEMIGWDGFFSTYLVGNAAEVPVKLSYNKEKHLVTAQT